MTCIALCAIFADHCRVPISLDTAQYPGLGQWLVGQRTAYNQLQKNITAKLRAAENLPQLPQRRRAKRLRKISVEQVAMLQEVGVDFTPYHMQHVDPKETHAEAKRNFAKLHAKLLSDVAAADAASKTQASKPRAAAPADGKAVLKSPQVPAKRRHPTSEQPQGTFVRTDAAVAETPPSKMRRRCQSCGYVCIGRRLRGLFDTPTELCVCFVFLYAFRAAGAPRAPDSSSQPTATLQVRCATLHLSLLHLTNNVLLHPTATSLPSRYVNSGTVKSTLV